MALQIRRGTDAERQSITPSEGELIYATDTNQLFVGGKISPSPTLAQGGILVSGALVNDTDPTLSSNLDLNGNDITGTGNISINGTITATGNINLGDGVEDNVIVGGQISSSLIPSADGNYDLGAPSGAWKDVYTVAINVETTASVGDLEISNSIIATDSSVIYDATTSSLNIANATITGDIDFGGNIISDSTVVYNGVTGDLTAANISSTGDLDASGTITSSQISTGDIASTGDIIALNGNIRSESVTTNSINAFDGILELTGSTAISGNADVDGVLTAASILTSSVQGDLIGSVFSNDSTLIIDGNSGVINAVNGILLTESIQSTAGQPIIIESNNPGQTLSVNGISSGGFGGEASLTIDGSKGTLENPQDTIANDIIGALKVRGYNNGAQVLGSIQQTSWDTSTNFSETYPKSNWRLLVNAGDGNGINGFSYMDLRHDGVLEGPVLKMNIVADATARDAAITSPEAGMTVFVTDVAKFQGYDGSAWVNLN